MMVSVLYLVRVVGGFKGGRGSISWEGHGSRGPLMDVQTTKISKWKRSYRNTYFSMLYIVNSDRKRKKSKID